MGCWEYDCDDARKGLDHLLELDIMLWTLMIGWYVQNGENENAVDLFCRMQTEGILPNELAMVGVLKACSSLAALDQGKHVHATTFKHGFRLEVPIGSALSTIHMGMVKEGWDYFNMMSDVYSITPRIDHYACMVDLLSRGGKLNEAKDFIESAPIDHGLCLWRILLSACRNYHNYELGAYAREKLMVEKVVVRRRYSGVMVVDDGGYDEFDYDMGCEYVVGINIELKG
ncbi:pentatricopeptide repeat-containing protein [Tanacetum coccineum]